MKSCKEYRQIGWNAVSGNWGNAIIFYILASLIIGALSCTVIGTLVVGPFVVGMYLYFIKAVRNEERTVDALFHPAKIDFQRTMILFLLKWIYVSLWSLLFFIPGIIKSYAYSMAEFIAIDNPNLSANECITQSRALMDGKKGKLFLLDLSFIGWMLLCVLTLGVLTFWVAPFQQATRAAFYEDIKGQAQAQA